jgi:hypothetical protein
MVGLTGRILIRVILIAACIHGAQVSGFKPSREIPARNIKLSLDAQWKCKVASRRSMKELPDERFASSASSN